jgi:hypothetical protein
MERTREKTLAVTVREGCVVYHEGTGYGPGQTFELAAADARQLLEQGVVDKA